MSERIAISWSFGREDCGFGENQTVTLAVAHAIIDPTAYPSKSYFLYRGNPQAGVGDVPGTLAV